MDAQHKLVVIGSADENVDLIKHAKNRGYYVIVCDGYDKSHLKGLVDKTYDIDVRDVETIALMCKDEQVDGIVGSFSDLVFEQVTKIAAKAGLRWYAKPEMLKNYRDKYAQKTLLEQLGITVPKFDIVTNDMVNEGLNNFSFPVVVKPVNGWGSRNIAVFDNLDEIKDFMSSQDDDNEYEIEEYFDAYEYNSISWLVDGKVHVLGISDRERNPRKGNDVATLNRIVYPSKKMPELVSKVQGVLEKFISVTGQKDGPLSMQFFYKDGEIAVVEIAGRVLGHEHDLIHYCGGSDVKELLLDYVYGDNSDIQKDIISMRDDAIAAGIYFVATRGSYMQDLTQIIPLFEKEQVNAYKVFGKEGYVYNRVFPYLAKCYFKASNRRDIDEKTERLYSEIYAGDKEGNNIVVPFVLEDRK